MAVIDKKSVVILNNPNTGFILYAGYVLRSSILKPRYYVVGSFSNPNTAATWYSGLADNFEVEDTTIKYLTKQYLDATL